MANVLNGVETGNFNHLSRVHERYRRQTDGRAIAYSKRIHEFTFAKNQLRLARVTLKYSLPHFL